jgi:hypothetical protein
LATEENLGELYVKISADVSQLEKDVRAIKAKYEKELPKAKIDFDTSLGKLKIADLEKYYNKLKGVFEKKILLNADVGSIRRTGDQLKQVESILDGVKRKADDTNKSFNLWDKVKDIGATLGLAYGAREFVQFIKEAVIASAELEVLRSNFKGTGRDIELFRIATAGTVSEANLIKLSNQATDLGISLEQQTIFFSLAEDAADKYGTGVEEGMQKVIMASEGNKRGLKSLGIQKAAYTELVKELAKAEGDTFEKLDAETQKQIQINAVLKATGMTIEEVKNKLPDAKDEIEQFYIGLEELKTGFGDIIRDGIPEFLYLMQGVLTGTLQETIATNIGIPVSHLL